MWAFYPVCPVQIKSIFSLKLNSGLGSETLNRGLIGSADGLIDLELGEMHTKRID